MTREENQSDRFGNGLAEMPLSKSERIVYNIKGTYAVEKA
jgi:hypothetical protein